MSSSKKMVSVLAEFDSTAALTHACEKVRDAGYQAWDCHTSFPVHGLDKAMGLKPSVLPWIVFVMGLTGATGAMVLQWWTSVVAYPLVISGKPFFSWQAFIPITFEVMVLFAAGTAFLGMLGLNKLPRYHHPLFVSKRFEHATDNKFFISIEAEDPKFDSVKTLDLLKKCGASHVELIPEEAAHEAK